MAPRLSVYLIVKNEARDLPVCLESIKALTEEIIVVDDFSTDNTAQIARSYGARVFQRKMEGYGTQKQFALEQCHGDWVFSLDADERVTPALASELKRLLDHPGPTMGYEVPRHMFFLGKRLRFGGVGTDHVLRFFKREKGKYLPLEIHERVNVQGPVGILSGALDHYSYASLEDYLQKIPIYTDLSARARWSQGKRFSLWHHLRPGWELFLRVILRGAWLDGQAGLTYAALSAHAAWLRSIRLRELEQEAARTNPSAARS